VRVRLDGREKSVGTCGAPPAVDQLMEEVESLARVWRWIVYDPQELRSDIARGWNDHRPMLMQDAITWDADEIIQILASHGADVNGLDDSNDHFLERAVRLPSNRECSLAPLAKTFSAPALVSQRAKVENRLGGSNQRAQTKTRVCASK
jgi:hypothetical protein